MADSTYTLDTPVASVDSLDSTEVAVARLMSQYACQPKVVAYLNSFLSECDELETKICELETLRYLELAEGQQLDNLGDLLSQPRLGFDDDDYRKFLQARVLANLSSGTEDEIIRVFQAITDVGATIDLQEIFPANVELEVSQPTVINTKIYRQLLADAVAVGIGSTFIYLPPDPFTFSTDAAPPTEPGPYVPTIDTTLGFADSVTPTTGGRFSAV